MNRVLNMLEEVMVKVEQHEIAFIIFSVIALLYFGALLYIICSLVETRHDLRTLQESLLDGHNKLASRLLEQEQNLNRVRRAGANNFRLICKVGVISGTLPESAVMEALEGVEE